METLLFLMLFNCAIVDDGAPFHVAFDHEVVLQVDPGLTYRTTTSYPSDPGDEWCRVECMRHRLDFEASGSAKGCLLMDAQKVPDKLGPRCKCSWCCGKCKQSVR